MIKKNVYDVLFIIGLALVLALVYLSGLNEWLGRFLYVPFLAVYFIGKWVGKLEMRKKDGNFL